MCTYLIYVYVRLSIIKTLCYVMFYVARYGGKPGACGAEFCFLVKRQCST